MATPEANPARRVCVAFSSAGRRVGLMQAFRADAARLGIELRVLALDARPELSAACQLADAALPVPRCSDPSYVPTLVSICREHQVRLLVPTIDPELLPLSLQRDAFAGVGTRVVVPVPDVVRVANDKQLTATRLAAADIPTPRSLLLRDYLRDPTALQGAVIAKPIAGSASVGIVRPGSTSDLAGLSPNGYVVQECWSGTEYTVNVYYDANSRLVSAVPHQRIEVRAGEVSKGRTERLEALLEVARRLPQALPGITGPLCFQAIVRPDGGFVVFEINARFGGGYPLAHRAGARFSQWLLEETLGLPSTANGEWREHVLMLRYDEAVYRDG